MDHFGGEMCSTFKQNGNFYVVKRFFCKPEGVQCRFRNYTSIS